MKTESKTYPKIQRSKREGKIFFPDNIQEIEKEVDEGKETETFYSYDLLKIPDKDQQIKDYNLFKTENYAALRQLKYGSWQEQLEVMQEQGFKAWKAECDAIKTKLPKT